MVVGLPASCWRECSSLNSLVEAVKIVCIGFSPDAVCHVAAVQSHKIVPWCLHEKVDVLLQQPIDALLQHARKSCGECSVAQCLHGDERAAAMVQVRRVTAKDQCVALAHKQHVALPLKPCADPGCLSLSANWLKWQVCYSAG